MQPEKVFKIGPNVASVFRNQYGYTVNVHRRYKSKDTDEWLSSSYFRLVDLPQVALLIQMATEYVAQREAIVTRQEQQSTDPSEETVEGDSSDGEYCTAA